MPVLSKKNIMKKSMNISLRIIAMFTVEIIMSFIPDYAHLFFGDTFCTGNITTGLCPNGFSSFNYTHGAEWHYGYRHWLFFSMGTSLFLVQLVGIFSKIGDV